MIETASRADLSPQPLYELALGFAGTKTLLVATRLGLFDDLAAAPASAAEIAARHEFSTRATEMLLNACVSLQLCSKDGERYRNMPLAQRYLVSTEPNYLGGFLNHFNDHMYPAWGHLEETIRTGLGQMNRVLGGADRALFGAMSKPQDLETFMETMEAHSLLEGDALAEAYDFSSHRILLDVGGGTGAMSVAILRQNPRLKAIVYDRPPVASIARQKIVSHRLEDRIEFVEGDFFKGPLPGSADVVLLSGILHNWSRENGQRILEQCASVLTAGGTLLISEQILSEDKTTPLLATLCSLNMAVVLEQGEEYSLSDLSRMLAQAGFKTVEQRRTSGLRQLVIAHRI